MSEYVDTILLEANRKSSPAYIAGNTGSKNEWTNNMGSGIKLDIGDRISLHSSYVSEIGNESSTMEIKGQDFPYIHSASNTTVVKLSNDVEFGDVAYQYNQEDVFIPLKQNEMTLTHSYYKSSNADSYYFSLPRGGSWNDTHFFQSAAKIWYDENSSATGALAVPEKLKIIDRYYYKPDFQQTFYYATTDGVRGLKALADDDFTSSRFEIVNDGSNYTIFVQRSSFNYDDGGVLDERRDPALYDFIWYKRTNTYKLPTGFNSPENIGNNITNQLSNIDKLTNENIRDSQDELTDGSDQQSNFSLKGVSKTNELFPCATGMGGGATMIKNFHARVGGEYGEITLAVTSSPAAGTADVNSIEVSATDYAKISHFGYRIINVPPTAGAKHTPVEVMGAMVIDKVSHGVGAGAVYLIYIDRQFLKDANLIGDFVLDQETVYKNYQASYASIGVKRPDLYEKGRLISVNEITIDDFKSVTLKNKSLDNSWKLINGSGVTGDGIYYHPLSSASNTVPNVLTTSLEWTDSNLLLLKNYFKTQKSHPELFSYSTMSDGQKKYVTVDEVSFESLSTETSRFLHMNNYQSEELEVTFSDYGELNKFVVRVTAAASIITKIKLNDFESGGGWFFSNDITDNIPLPNGSIIVSLVPVTVTEIEITFNTFFREQVPVGFVFKLTNRKVGDDKYNGTAAPADPDPKVNFGAPALFFDFNTEREEINLGIGDYFESLRYGFGVRVQIGDKYYIGYRFDKLGMSAAWFSDPATTMNLETTAKSVGFDKHFNSYGNAFLCLNNGAAGVYGSAYNGTATTSGDPTKILYLATYNPRDQDGGNSGPQGGGGTGALRPPAPLQFRSTMLMNEIYLGANNPLFQFNPNNSRFEFSLLHTPEIIQQLTNASTQTADSGNPVYKINKVVNQNTYSPSFIPYSYNFLSATEVLLEENIVPYSIMDTCSGIYIEDWGVNEKYWVDSIWELLGFTYEQLHRTKATRLSRVTATGLQSSVATTNALIETSDLQNFRKDSKNFFLPDPLGNNYPQYQVSSDAQWGPTDIRIALPGTNMFRAVVQTATSVAISAENLPRKMISPIYLIRSDILSANYIGGADGCSALPVIGVCPKDSGYGDYFNGRSGEIFTNTIPRVIQNITTGIFDADGTPSRVDDGSLVIYKIQKNKTSNGNLAADILKQNKK